MARTNHFKREWYEKQSRLSQINLLLLCLPFSWSNPLKNKPIRDPLGLTHIPNFSESVFQL